MKYQMNYGTTGFRKVPIDLEKGLNFKNTRVQKRREK